MPCSGCACKCKCTFGWSCLVVTFATFVSLGFSSCLLDHWMVNDQTTMEEPWLRISKDGNHHHTSTQIIHPHITPQRIRYFGIWTVCDYYDDLQCADADLFLRHRILEIPSKAPFWLHMARFFIVIALLCMGFGVLIGLYTVVNNSKSASLGYVLNFFGLFLMTFVLAYMRSCLPHYMPPEYRLSTSYVVSWAVVGNGYLCTAVYVVCKFWMKKTSETWRPWEDA